MSVRVGTRSVRRSLVHPHRPDAERAGAHALLGDRTDPVSGNRACLQVFGTGTGVDPGQPSGQEALPSESFGAGAPGAPDDRAPTRADTHRHEADTDRHGNLVRTLSSVQRFRTTRYESSLISAEYVVICHQRRNLRFPRFQIWLHIQCVVIFRADTNSMAEAIRRVGIREVTFSRWRKEDAGRNGDQLRCRKDLEKENERLRRAVSDLALDQQILEEAARGTFRAPRVAADVSILSVISWRSRNSGRPGAGAAPLDPAPNLARPCRREASGCGSDRAGSPAGPLRLPPHRGPAARRRLAGPRTTRGSNAGGGARGGRCLPDPGNGADGGLRDGSGVRLRAERVHPVRSYDFVPHRTRDGPAFLRPGSPRENGFIESFHARWRDELRNGEIFSTLKEARILIESRRRHDHAVRLHGSLGSRPPAPETILSGRPAWRRSRPFTNIRTEPVDGGRPAPGETGAPGPLRPEIPYD